MKSIKWLFTLILVAMLALTACKSKQVTSADDPASNPRGDDTQPNNFGAENDSIDGTEGGEEVKDEAGEESVLDTEAMAAHLGDFVLRPDDMSHSYYVPDGGEQRKATIRLIQDMGEVEAKTYVRDTRRVDGWWIKLQRANKIDFAPGAFESSLELFDNADGAQMAMSPAYYELFQDGDRSYSQVDGGCDLGDFCEFYYSEKEDPTTELITAQYNIAFTYKNAFVWVMARGLEIDMDSDYVLDAAGLVFNKLENAPMN